MYQALTILATLRARAAAKRRDEDGFAIPELLAIAALSVALLIVLFAALQKLGVDVIDKVRTQIGL